MPPLEGTEQFLGSIVVDAKTTKGESHNADLCWDGDWRDREDKRGFYDDVKQLNCKYPISRYQQWSDAGCASCRMLLCVVDEFWPGWKSESPNAGQSIGLDNNGKTVTVTLLTVEEIVGSFQLFRRETAEPMYFQGPDPTHGSILGTSLKIVSDSRSEAAFDRAAKWLSRCLDYDSGCEPPSSTFKPHRLLSVGSSENAFQMFLFEPKDPVSYVCLSYCWGSDSDDVLKTTKSNLRSHYYGILFSLLPQTLRDAVIVCRKLEISNLWVDSLCIIQDDVDDWLLESAQMLDIYANSHLTIVAREPASCKAGFLGAQRYGSAEWQRLSYANIPNDHGPQMFIRAGRVNSGACSLDKRGWCFQEGIIPNRKLIFDGNEMAWECSRSRICECGHLTRDFDDGRSKFSDLKNVLRLEQQENQQYDYRNVQGDWRSLVAQYSHRYLSQETDKLSAISGLAKLVSKATNSTSDDYLAGLWRNSFVTGLAWCVNKRGFLPGHMPHRRQLRYRAPTWSWASIDGPVKYNYLDNVSKWSKNCRVINVHHVSIEEVICNLVLPSDSTGPITSGYAILTGPLVPVELVVLDKDLASEWDSWNATKVGHDWKWKRPVEVALIRAQNARSYYVNLDLQMGPSLRKGDPRFNCWIRRRCTDGGCPQHLEKPGEVRLEGNGVRYYCLQLFSFEDHRRQWRDGKRVMKAPESWYLVLQKSQTAEDAYERIGIGVWDVDYDEKDGGVREYDNIGLRFHCPLFETATKTTIKII